MRLILFSLILSVFIYADEIQRIESIVNDITKLRLDYEECKTKLKSQKIKKIVPEVSIEKIKENVCKKEKSQIKELKNILKTRDKKIVNLENEIKRLKKKQIKIIKKSDNSNKFPKLLMKPEYKKTSEYIEIFKAKSFYLKKDTNIYDARNGKKSDRWEENTTFTSNTKHGKWMKITGYFVDKKWRKAQKNLWIREIDIAQK